MDEISFTALAPRRGTRPLLSDSTAFGLSNMNGGAFNWGSIWSGLKSFGSTIKNVGNKAWNSSTGQALREKLRDTNVQDKIVDTISSGIHGALDLTRQELDKAIANRLEESPNMSLHSQSAAQKLAESIDEEFKKGKKSDEYKKGKHRRKRHLSEDLEESPILALPPPPPVLALPPPPSYNEIFSVEDKPRPLKSYEPSSLPITQSTSTSNSTPPQSLPNLPYRGRANWQSTLSNIVGLGVHSLKKRRCF